MITKYLNTGMKGNLRGYLILMTTHCRICTVSDSWLPSLVLNAFRHGQLSVSCGGPVTLFTNSDSLKGFSYFGLTTAFLFFLSIDPSSAPLWYLKLFDSSNHIFSWFCKMLYFSSCDIVLHAFYIYPFCQVTLKMAY